MRPFLVFHKLLEPCLALDLFYFESLLCRWYSGEATGAKLLIWLLKKYMCELPDFFYVFRHFSILFCFEFVNSRYVTFWCEPEAQILLICCFKSLFGSFAFKPTFLSLEKSLSNRLRWSYGFLNALFNHQCVQWCLLSPPLQVPYVVEMRLGSPVECCEMPWLFLQWLLPKAKSEVQGEEYCRSCSTNIPYAFVKCLSKISVFMTYSIQVSKVLNHSQFSITFLGPWTFFISVDYPVIFTYRIIEFRKLLEKFRSW
jgi:hypothetical protein